MFEFGGIMKDQFYKNIIKNGSFGYVYQKLLVNKANEITDLVFVEANNVFEKIVKTKVRKLVGSKASSLGADVQAYLDIIITSLNEAKGKTDRKNIRYFKSIRKAYNLMFYVPKNDHLVTIFVEVQEINDPLLDSSGRYKTMVNNMNDCLWILDVNLSYSYLSPSSKKIFGYTPEEMMKIPLQDIMTKKSYSRISRLYYVTLKHKEKIRDKERTLTIDLTHIKKDGSKVHVEHLIQLFRDEEGVVQGIMGIARDVTEFVTAKENLRKSKEELQLILNSTAEGIFRMDLEGNCTFCNESFLRIFGYKNQEQVLGKNIRTFFYYDDEDRLKKGFANDFQNFVDKEVFRKADDSSFIGEYFTYPQYYQGEIIGAVITFLDITNRIQVEQELAETERSRAVLLQNLPGMAFRCKFDKNRTLLFASDGCLKLTGYKPEHLIHNRDLAFNDIIKPEFREMIWNSWCNAVVNQTNCRTEYIITMENGTEKWVLEQGEVIYNILGEVEALEGLIIDINSQKRKQEEIEYLSYHDHLTGIYNRIYFDQQVQRFDHPLYYPVSIIIGDINGLKFLNDALGHQEGDKIIQTTARLLGESIPEGTILARTGGDEFSILMPNTNSNKAYKLLQKISNYLTDYNNSLPSDAYKINLALGYATKNSVNAEFSSIYKLAEDHMYKRKLLQRDSSHSSIISSITATMYAKSQETEEHAERIKRLTQLFGEKINLNQEQIDDLALLATLHDIGKVGIDENILNKTGKLTDAEWGEMRKHPEIGYRIAMASPELMSIAEYVLCHHERWDGQGYPRGLKGEEIPILARIIAIVDAYDAMRSNRPYRKALNKERAIEEIKVNAGTQFDPEYANLFVDFLLNDQDFSD